MTLLQVGSRGPQVAELQTLLNRKPTRLPLLFGDGIFGPKTRARVIEFQKDSGLKADGIVGDLTMAKLRNGVRPGGEIDLQAVMLEIANVLDPPLRPQFLVQAQALLANRNLFGFSEAVPLVIVVLFFIMLMMIVLMQNSANPANREMAKEWNRRVNNLKERIRGKPVEVQTAESLEETKRMGQDVAQRAREEREKCLSNLDPTKLTKCSRQIKALSEAIQSLLQKMVTRLGGGITPENLVKGIGNSARGVFEAARAMGECTGCDNMFF